MINFTKMHGIGNDFIVINQINTNFNLSSKTIKSLANRNFGIGFDQLLIVESTKNIKAEFKYRIFNADGKEVEQCGNGARCFYRYIQHHKLTENKTVLVETKSGIIELTETSEEHISVNMGRPVLKTSSSTDEYILVSLGNPHAVMTVNKNPNWEKYITIGKKIQSKFSDGVNVGFMLIIDKKNIKLKVLERGSGLTLACGTGACAASAVAISKGLVESPVKVHMDGGDLDIKWDGTNSMTMSGPAQIVYEGKVDLKSIANND